MVITTGMVLRIKKRRLYINIKVSKRGVAQRIRLEDKNKSASNVSEKLKTKENK